MEKLNFYGLPLKVLDRCEPSDIIWTHKEIKGLKKCRIFAGIILLSIMMTMAFFSIVFTLKTKGYQLKKLFPKVSECASVWKDYENKHEQFENYV